ncbi:hypothetical protein OIU78_022056 [Salix suchowensis]|nr:hypothetical protein OIU78_022056 [Salix suchowensis]
MKLACCSESYSMPSTREANTYWKMLSHVTAFFEDLSLRTPVVGEQNAKQFLRNLMKAMGPDMRFRINVTDYEQSKDDQNIATAFWHLEWDSKEIPFTRGRSVCECGEADEKILIRKITGEAEPGGLGDSMLKLVEAARTAFGNFP